VIALSYPARLRRDSTGGYYLKFRDVAGANTGDDDRATTLAGAADCLAVALKTYMELKRDIPPPSKSKRGEHLVAVPLELAPKLAVYQAMRAARVSNAELARRMKVRETIVRRILDPNTATRLETIEQALACLGKTATLTVASAA
jgi:antitoxin HicB